MENSIDLEQIVFTTQAEIGRVRNRWTPEEDRFLEENLSRLTLGDIAAALGRTVEAIKIRQVRMQIPAASKRPDYLTGNQAARALGMDIHSVVRLVERGIFPATRLPGLRQIIQITQLRLYMWAINPRHWMYFKISRMRDQHLKRLVLLAQARWGDEWLLIGQAEKMIGLGKHTLNQRIHRGMYTSADIVDWGNWWIRRSTLERTVIRPCRSIPNGINWHSPGADAFLRKMAGSRKSYEDIARMMKWSDFRVIYRMVQLGLIECPKHIARWHNWDKHYGQ
jgi:hypothetical protein